MKLIRILSEIILIILGIGLVIDSLFIHALTLDYSKYGIQPLDGIINHWMLGLVFVIIGVSALIIEGVLNVQKTKRSNYKRSQRL